MTVQELISLLLNCRPDAIVGMPGELDCDTPMCVRPTEFVTLDDDTISRGGLSDDPEDLYKARAAGREVLPGVILDPQLRDPYESIREDYRQQTEKLNTDRG